ncbi:15-hydroxyprostaglandin dehydrogenase [NAD(+)] [Exaiptasia diaphana]|uniref:15-hydroxyprostaglandin dehydrogenase [NAD(+)] n=1 Tax=Exaiptasia diaphana TaxID=2652724 RepID=A0A913XW83_EXADI|nr:15-hydroxyprostaglandin dehydrogenase [NAD(+)] [Exaiptasia diaphana]KXJ24274.1 15-hydroxyprostaglandin dehydrogenase [NAD(+)] [Exaiptasia diaphana]
MKIAGKVAVVTGGAQGIGKEICKALLVRGANVCILDINKHEGQNQTKVFQNMFSQKQVLFVPCDVSKRDQFEAAFQRTHAQFGHIDIVCNNAGIFSKHDMADNVFEKVIDINMKGVILGTKLGLQYMGTSGSKGHGGVIVNVASVAGLVPAPDHPVYAGTKHAVVGFTRSLAIRALTKDSVRVNCICPSFTDTDMVRSGGLDDPKLQENAAIQFIAKYGLLSPELIATGVIELIEDDSKNGAVMRVTKQKGIDYKKYHEPKL